jgi:hypothetical protein
VVTAALVRAAAAAPRGRRAAPLVAVAAGVVAFPFIYALVPSAGYWVDGRYGVELPSLLAMLLALALVGPGRRPVAAPPELLAARAARHARRPADRRPSGVGRGVLAVACAGLVAAGILTAGTARADQVPADPHTFFTGWSDPEAPVREVAAALAAHGIRYAYGDYWTAYVLDFVDPKALVVSPSSLDVVRWPAEAAAVGAAARPAWLFYAPGRTAAASLAFSNPEPGPGNYTEAQFESFLQGRGVPYRVVHLGLLDAVVPARRVRLPSP